MKKLVLETTAPFQGLPELVADQEGLFTKEGLEIEWVERVVNGIVRRLESSGESEIPSTQIGELVMDALRALDPVAYVRFASVYRNFREARDFEEFISDLAETNLKD